MTYKAVIFDLDGTLVNSIEDIADAMNTVLQAYNFPTHDYDTYKTFVGSGVKSLVIKSLPEGERQDNQVKNCHTAMMNIYKNQCTNKTKPYDGIVELLDALKSTDLKMSILSNKADALTKKVVSTLFSDYFNPVLGLKIEAHKKPNPIVALEICATLGLDPEQVIYVGDTGIDIKTAKNANMLAVGVSWGFRNTEELIENGANHILEKPLDLMAIL
ncbi:HAD family hydrolase [Algibacter mikhailovii]|uniref:HAD family hydrolase n=1 Tax=Algibacter mikhailovii TaxID=425498 RepID=UPI002493EE93|nr:HAD family hydrolase [Algibacter mikhailovii]